MNRIGINFKVTTFSSCKQASEVVSEEGKCQKVRVATFAVNYLVSSIDNSLRFSITQNLFVFLAGLCKGSMGSLGSVSAVRAFISYFRVSFA